MASCATQKVMIRQRETIKPISPTPSNKKTLKLSAVDQILPHAYIPFLLLYSSIHTSNTTIPQICKHLKDSLSKTLEILYPLAGRVVDNSHVNCDDSGVEFVQAEIQSPLSDYFTSPDAQRLEVFLPLPASEESSRMLLLIQANFFQCGGLVIGLRMSHKVSDIATFSTFVDCWSTVALGIKPKEEISIFVGDSYIPQIEIKIPSINVPSELMNDDCEYKRFVFNSTKIEVLKAKMTTGYSCLLGTNLTRFEIITSLIWKCAIKARAKLGSSKPSMMYFAVNLRRRFVPHLPKTYAGNLIVLLNAKMHQDCYEVGLADLIFEIKKEINRVNDEVERKEMMTGQNILEHYNEYYHNLIRSDVDCYSMTSWCNFDFYKADFKWGKPTWLSIACPASKNGGTLFDTRDGKGVEAWFGLEKDAMALFKCDPELLEYAEVDPLNSFI